MALKRRAKTPESEAAADKPAAERSKVMTIMIVITLLVGLWFILPFLSVLVLSALMAYVFYPLFKKLQRGSGRLAAVGTLIISCLVVLLPLAFVAVALASQLANLATTASQSATWRHVPSFVGPALGLANDIMAPVTGVRPSITEQGIIDFLRTIMPVAARTVGQVMLSFVGSLPQMGIAFIVYMFTFVEFLLYGPRLLAKLEVLSPFNKEVTRYYFERIGLMANAMMRGQLIISMIISAISATLLVPLGYGRYFFVFFVLFTILNFIPLGCGIILVPLTIYAMLTGQFWIGAVVLALYYLAGNLDAPLRARFIPKKIQLSIGLTMVATFCGVAYFGLLGVVYGPIIMIIIVTTIDLFVRSKSDEPAMSAKPKII